jgi:aquaporin Z
MGLICMTNHLTRAQFNPAVTIAMFLRGGHTPAGALCYVVAELLGGLTAGAIAHVVVGDAFRLHIPHEGKVRRVLSPCSQRRLMLHAHIAVTAHGVRLLADMWAQAWVMEAIWTFALLGTMHLNAPSSFFTGNTPIAVTMVIIAGGFIAGGVSGGIFNPAVALGVCYAARRESAYWIYLVRGVSLRHVTRVDVDALNVWR